MKLRWLVVAGAALVVVGLLFVTFAGSVVGGGMLAALSAGTAEAATCQATPDLPDAPPVDQLNAEQARNAAAIIQAGRDIQVPERAWVIAVAVAYQESTLINVDHGDDWYFGGAGRSPSRGLFQQMPSWGPLEVRMDPRGSARLFYEHLLSPVDWRGQPKPRWDTVPLAQAAQAVQGSAFPAEYAKHEAFAQRVVKDLAGVTVASSACQQAGPAAPVDGWMLPFPAGKVHAPVAEHHNYPAADLPLPPGETQPVFAMAAGTATPMDEFTTGPDGPGGCGHGVYVRGATGEWLYCHLSQQLVQAGQQVGPGVQIGVSGWSGGVRPVGPGGSHLHVQLSRGGRLTCVQPILDALKAGQAPPPLDRLPTPATNTCLRDWDAQGRH